MAITLWKEFEQQWNSLCNYLESEMMKANRQQGTIELNHIEKLLANEKKRWRIPGQYHNAWLEKLRKGNPDVAEKFENALEEVKMEQIQPSPQPSGLYSMGLAAGGAVIGFTVTKLMEVAVVISVVGTVGVGFIGVLVGRGIYQTKQQEATDRDCKAYMEQLKLAGRKLAEIVKKADE